MPAAVTTATASTRRTTTNPSKSTTSWRGPPRQVLHTCTNGQTSLVLKSGLPGPFDLLAKQEAAVRRDRPCVVRPWRWQGGHRAPRSASHSVSGAHTEHGRQGGDAWGAVVQDGGDLASFRAGERGGADGLAGAAVDGARRGPRLPGPRSGEAVSRIVRMVTRTARSDRPESRVSICPSSVSRTLSGLPARSSRPLRGRRALPPVQPPAWCGGCAGWPATPRA